MAQQHTPAIWALLWVPVWCSGGCTFDRSAPVFSEVREVRGTGSTSDASGMAVAGMGGGPAPAPAPSPSATAEDAGPPDAGGSPDATAAPEAGPRRDAGPAACVRPMVAVCDPVTNQGCSAELGMQCAVDALATAPTGYCTFSAPMDGGSDCLDTGLTVSCPPTMTCHDGRCRDLCLCDDDCDQGECCAEPIGTTGFGVCDAC